MPRILRTWAAVVAALAAARGAADDGELRYRLALHARFTQLVNEPSPDLRFDPAQRTFDLAAYLRPQGSDAYPSALVSAGVEGRRGRFRFGLAADTGELRSQRPPELLPVCLAPLAQSPTGLDVVGSGNCRLLVAGHRAVAPLDGTRLAGARLTSNGRPFEDEARATFLVREAWAGAVLGRNDFALVRAGRQRFTIGDGFVHDDWGLGVQASFDLGQLGPSWELAASAFYPTRELPAGDGWVSPVLAVRADYLPSLFEHAGFFAAFFRDRADAGVELVRAGLAEAGALRLAALSPGTLAYAGEARRLAVLLDRPLGSDADLGWVGTSGSLRLGGARLDWTGALAVGTLALRDVELVESAGAVTAATVTRDVDVLGELAWLRLRVHAARGLQLGGFLLFLSGDAPPLERLRQGQAGRYGGFFGVNPFVTATNLFFAGGASESFASRQASWPGVNGRGVAAPGLTASWDGPAGVGVDARAAYLVAPEAGPYGGRVYGPEVDLQISASPWPWLTLTAEGDVLLPGDFFPSRSPVTKLVLAIDVVAR